jgi:cytochrome c oxidase subunit 5a
VSSWGAPRKGKELTIAQRNLNNCFAYDLVPSPSVITAALRAARRVNDFPSAVRVFEGTWTAEYVVLLRPSIPHSRKRAYSEAHLQWICEQPFSPVWLLTRPIGVKFKVENKNQYEEYLQELEPIREELGIPLKEAMYPDEK